MVIVIIIYFQNSTHINNYSLFSSLSSHFGFRLRSLLSSFFFFFVWKVSLTYTADKRIVCNFCNNDVEYATELKNKKGWKIYICRVLIQESFKHFPQSHISNFDILRYIFFFTYTYSIYLNFYFFFFFVISHKFFSFQNKSYSFSDAG